MRVIWWRDISGLFFLLLKGIWNRLNARKGSSQKIAVSRGRRGSLRAIGLIAGSFAV